MKSFVYWLMGEQAGKATVNSWNWLVGAPPDSSSPPTNSLEVAEAALEPLKASVQKLSQAVSTQRAAYARIKQKSEAKQRELEKLEQEAAIAQDRGDESTARLTMARMIQLEEVLPQFQEQTYRAQEYLRMFQEKLSQEQIKLEAYEANLTNLKDMQDVNEALALISQVNQQFEPTRLNVEQQNLEQQALAELTLGTEGQLEMEIDPTQSVDAIAERLQQLKSRPASGPPE